MARQPVRTRSTPSVAIARMDERVVALSERVESYHRQDAEAHERVEKGFDKLSSSLDKLGDKMGEYNSHLAEHMKRSDIAERRLDLNEATIKAAQELATHAHAAVLKWQNRATFGAKILIGLGGLAAFAAATVQVLDWLGMHG